MSSTPSAPSETRQPDWLWPLLGTDGPWAGERAIDDQPFVVTRGIPRSRALLSDAQAQTEETFGFKWKKRDTFESDAWLGGMRKWLIERYGDPVETGVMASVGERPILLDAGCGAAVSALELFGPAMASIRYLGVDVSEAVDVAATRFSERGLDGAFVQADISQPPFRPGSVDIVFSEGVLHHTNSTRGAIDALAPLIRPGGLFMFYVYRRKGPIREFTDDYVRDRLQAMTPEQAWAAMEPLTKLGIALGELDVEIDVPERIELLDIPAGRINVQRLFYWHVAKMFFRDDLTLDEMNHINFDWYAPANAARQSVEDVRAWCAAAGLEIEREVAEEAGITVVARKIG